MKTLFLAGLLAAVICTAASAQISYTNTAGGTVYELDAPTGWAVIGGFPQTIVLPGAGPNGHDAYYRSGNTGGTDDSTQVYWNFSFAALPNVAHNLAAGLYTFQAYVSDYGNLPHEAEAVYGSRNGPWGWNAVGLVSGWNGVPQDTPGWTSPDKWMDNGELWLSNTGDPLDVTITLKLNPWGGYGGVAVSGVRICTSTDENFIIAPEPSSLLALLAGLPVLAILRRKR